MTEKKFMIKYLTPIITFICIIAVNNAGLAAAAAADYWGKTGSSVIAMTGCNATSNVQVPGTTDLFIARSLFKKDGTPVTPEEKCGEDEGIREAAKSNRWGMVVSRLNWQKKKFSIIKPLVVSTTVIPAGPDRGGILRVSDPDIIKYRGQYLMAFECLLVNGAKYKAHGTSACLSTYDPVKQRMRLGRTYAVVSGEHKGSDFYSASVPNLLEFKGKLYLYWATVQVRQGKFIRNTVRGVELEANKAGLFWAKGVGHIVSTIGPPTTEVWAPVEGNPMSDSAVDIKSVWTHNNEIVMIVDLGGSGCTTALGHQPGCFRMGIAKTSEPLGHDIFNKSPLLHEDELPTNGQGFTRPIRNPEGGYSLLGGFRKPWKNGFSETRPLPPDALSSRVDRVNLVLFPFPDKDLWPTQPQSNKENPMGEGAD